MVEFESKDRVDGKITMRVISSNILKNYKTFRVVTSITPKEDGDGIHVTWTLVYMKINDDINTPSRRSVEFDVKSPGDELFKTFTKSLIRNGNFSTYISLIHHLHSHFSIKFLICMFHQKLRWLSSSRIGIIEELR